MDRFHLIDEAAVILVSKSVYRQAKVFRRGVGIYAAYGSGFVRLYAGGATGLPSVRWDDIELPGISKAELVDEGFGKLAIPQTKLIEAK